MSPHTATSPASNSLPRTSPSHALYDAKTSTTTLGSSTSSSLTTTARAEATILDILRRRAIQTPDRVCYIFVDDNGNEVRSLTYANVDAEARRIASVLQHQSKTSPFTPGDRVLLCFPPGADFTLAFWGCLYAGAIACAVYPPHPLFLSRDLVRFRRMVDETGAKLVLTNTSYRRQSQLGTISARLRNQRGIEWPSHLHWFCTEKASASTPEFDASHYVNVAPSDIAFLQYTSGTTADPKAVVISHRNIYAQVQLWTHLKEGETMVSWLPPYHDNGLVGFNLAPIHVGSTSIQLSPFSFIKNPTLWMQLCSKYKAAFTCAPNFAYVLAAKKTSDAVAASLDLSHLHHAACGAEPIRGDYLKLFAKKFYAAGFRPNQFHCVYGGAEPTLVICGYTDPNRSAPRSLLVDKTILETKGKVQLLRADDPRRASGTGTLLFIACGRPGHTYDLRIVDPKSRTALPDGYTGEIWVHGDSIAEGYWQQWDLTRRRFQATLANDTSGRHYWRSTDLGFMHKGELFYYARLQDIVHVDGRCICPQTIEGSVEAASTQIRPGCAAVYSVTDSNGTSSSVVVVAELREQLKKGSESMLAGICRDICKRVAMEQSIEVARIVLLKPKTIPKTTSGKLQRTRIQHMVEQKTLQTQFIYYHNA